eukprot:TRINITY_DN35735_c0_g1_i1.p1 TRINITY_DN35735_c0_g1~~TRINITY_DN35735_c0_g1_i1.p1  ORF type:complete len:171 (+),score=44.38 TRINITY_DN35735_c0_g1_i1:145-657(+)
MAEGELGVVLRFLDESTADIVRAMLDEDCLELSIEMDSAHPGVGWVSIGTQHYRCKLVQLPTETEVFTQADTQVHRKALDVTEALIVARGPDDFGGSNADTVEVEMIPARLPDGLTSTTRNIREHYNRLDDAVPLAPSDADIATLLSEAQWLEQMKEDPKSTLKFRPVSP